MFLSLLTRWRAGVAAVLLALAAATASAQTAPLNTTADGIAMDGFDVVAYFTDGAPAMGHPDHAVDYQGARWLFASAERAAQFRADPARYAPQNNGWCSYAVSEGYAADVDFINGWSVIDGALFLNYDRETRDTFLASSDKRIAAAKGNWPRVSAGLVDGSVTLYRHADDPAVGIQHPQVME
jgi:YHS domain-containing protein